MNRFVKSCLIASFLALVAMSPKAVAQQKPKIQWQEGPTIGSLGDIAQLRVPEGYLFSGKDGTQKFLELNEVSSDGEELGVLVPDSRDPKSFWYATFRFEETGYVGDDEKNHLDDNTILGSIEKATEDANGTMQSRGWATVHVTGWKEAPIYDSVRNSLIWGVAGYSVDPKSGRAEITNYFFRLLGRRGVMSCQLVASADQIDAAVPSFESVLQGFSYLPGQKYSDFQSGDAKSKYGLTGLILGGGAVAIASKTGLLAVLWKFLVVIAAGVLATLKRIIRYLKKMFTGRASEEELSK